MLKIFHLPFFKIILYPLALYCIWASIALQNYQKIDKNNIPAFIILESKLSKKSINDFAKISNAKNIWIIADDNDFKQANQLIKESADAISYANQIGRLDLVSIFLAIIAVILGLFGIVGFLHVKGMVQTEIDRVAPSEIKRIAPKQIKKYLDEQFEEGGNMNKKVKDFTIKEVQKQFKEYAKKSIENESIIL
jgi:cytochrome c biogenesis factor